MTTRVPATADADSEVEGFIVIDEVSTPSSNFSLITDEANPPLPVSLSTSVLLPGGKNNKKKPKSVTFGTDTAPGDEPCAESFARELRQRDDAGSRDQDVRHWVFEDGRLVHAAPPPTSTRNGEDGSSTRAPTSASASSFVWPYHEGLESDLDVRAAGIWTDHATPYPEKLDLSDTE